MSALRASPVRGTGQLMYGKAQSVGSASPGGSVGKNDKAARMTKEQKKAFPKDATKMNSTDSGTNRANYPADNVGDFPHGRDGPSPKTTPPKAREPAKSFEDRPGCVLDHLGCDLEASTDQVRRENCPTSRRSTVPRADQRLRSRRRRSSAVG